MAIKSTADEKLKFEARVKIDLHRDRLRRLMVLTFQTIKTSSIILLVAVAALHEFNISSIDVKQPYIHSRKPISKKVIFEIHVQNLS